MAFSAGPSECRVLGVVTRHQVWQKKMEEKDDSLCQLSPCTTRGGGGGELKLGRSSMKKTTVPSRVPGNFARCSLFVAPVGRFGLICWGCSVTTGARPRRKPRPGQTLAMRLFLRTLNRAKHLADSDFGVPECRILVLVDFPSISTQATLYVDDFPSSTYCYPVAVTCMNSHHSRSGRLGDEEGQHQGVRSTRPAAASNNTVLLIGPGTTKPGSPPLGRERSPESHMPVGCKRVPSTEAGRGLVSGRLSHLWWQHPQTDSAEDTRQSCSSEASVLPSQQPLAILPLEPRCG